MNALDLKYIDTMTRKDFKQMVWLIITTFDLGEERKKDPGVSIYEFMHDLKGMVCESYDSGFSPRYTGQKIVNMSKKYGIMPQTFDAVDFVLEEKIALPLKFTNGDPTIFVTILDLLCLVSKSGNLRDKFVQLCQDFSDEVIVNKEDKEHILDKNILLQL